MNSCSWGWKSGAQHADFAGHPLHYDTNEQLLRDSQGRCVEHPAISSVVRLGTTYLKPGGGGGVLANIIACVCVLSLLPRLLSLIN